MELLLAEELLLLAHNRYGSPLIEKAVLERGVAGGLLADLAVRGKLGCRDSLVVVIDSAAPGREPLDKVLQQIAAVRLRQEPRWWVVQLAAKAWTGPLVNRMFKDGTWKIPVPRTELLASLADTLASDVEPDARAAALSALTDACRLSRQLFPGLDQRLLKRRMAVMSADQWAAAGVRQAVRGTDARRIARGAARVVDGVVSVVNFLPG